MEKYLTITECTEYLHVSRPTVIKICTEAKAMIQPDKRILIDREILDSYLERLRVEQNG